MSGADLSAGIEIGSTGAVVCISDGRRLRFRLTTEPRPDDPAAVSLKAVATELRGAPDSDAPSLRTVVASSLVSDPIQGSELRARLGGGALEGSLIVSKPFATAYTLSSIDAALVVDIGARGAEVGIVKGLYPRTEDSLSVATACGRAIDALLLAQVQCLQPSDKLSLAMMREWKERFGFLGPPARPVIVQPFDDAPKIDVTEEMRAACESVVEPLCDAVRKLLERAESAEERASLLHNIVLSGGSAWLRGLASGLEAALRSQGAARVRRVTNPTFACASGCLSIAKDLEEHDWERLAAL